MTEDELWIKENPKTVLIMIDKLRIAIAPFAERPSTSMDNFPCHVGINTKERCGRCSRAIAAWEAYAGSDIDKLKDS